MRPLPAALTTVAAVAVAVATTSLCPATPSALCKVEAASTPAPTHPESWSACETIDGDCPACPAGYTTDVTPHILLSAYPALQASAAAAEETISAADPGGGSIIRLEPLDGLHTSLFYFCCHNHTQITSMKQAFGALQWHSIRLNYTDAGCNLDHAGVVIYVHALLGNSSQVAMFAWAKDIEGAMQGVGVPVNVRRRE